MGCISHDITLQKVFLSVDEVCKIYRVCRRTLLKWRRNGLVTYKIKGKLFFRQCKVESFVAQFKKRKDYSL